MESRIQEPTQQQLESIAGSIKNGLALNLENANIACGIERVRVNEIGIISEVFVRPGLFARLCYYEFGGSRTRKPFEVNGFVVKQWRPKRG